MRFGAEVERRDRGFVVRLPFDPKEAFGRVRAPVAVSVNGHVFRTTGWVAEAKREETRERRVAQAVELLRAGVRTPDSAPAR